MPRPSLDEIFNTPQPNYNDPAVVANTMNDLYPQDNRPSLDEIFASQPSQPPAQVQPVETLQQSIPVASPQEASILDRIGADISKRIQSGQETANAYNTGQQGIGQTAVQFGGNVGLGTGADIIGEVAKSGFNSLPDSVRKPITNYVGEAANYVSDSPVGDVARKYGGMYDEWAKNNPNAARTVSGLGNLTALLPAGKASEVVGDIPVPKTLTSLISDEKSALSTNAATGGTQDYFGTRLKGMMAKNPEKLDNLSKQLHDEATPIYKAVDNAGGSLNSDGIANVRNSIDKSIGPEDELLDGPVLNLYNKMKTNMESGDISITKLDRYRRKFSAIAKDQRHSVVDGGGLKEEGRLAVQVIKGIDNALDEMLPEHFSNGGPEIVDALNAAREASARAQSFDRIARLAKKANGDPNRIKTALTTLTQDENKMKGLKAPEKAALKEAAGRGLGEYIERGLGTFGFDLGQRKNIALPTAASLATLLNPSAAAGVTLTTTARQLNKYAARGKLEAALNTIANRPVSSPSIGAFLQGGQP